MKENLDIETRLGRSLEYASRLQLKLDIATADIKQLKSELAKFHECDESNGCYDDCGRLHVSDTSASSFSWPSPTAKMRTVWHKVQGAPQTERLTEDRHSIWQEGYKAGVGVGLDAGDSLIRGLQAELARFYECKYMSDGPAHNHVYEVDEVDEVDEPSSRSHTVYHKKKDFRK